MTELRKQWKQEYLEKCAREEEQRRLERERLVRERAVRLRERREISLIKQAADRKAKAEALARYRQTLAKNHLILADKNEKQQERYQTLLDELKIEQTTWITLDNINSKITKELFDKEASTSGLLTRYSDHWRIYVESSNYDLKKLKAWCAEEYDKFDAMNVNQTDETTLEDRFSKDSRKSKLTNRLWVEDFVEGMITTGEDRAQFQDIIKAYMKELRHYDLGLPDSDDESYYSSDEDNDDEDWDNVDWNENDDSEDFEDGGEDDVE